MISNFGPYKGCIVVVHFPSFFFIQLRSKLWRQWNKGRSKTGLYALVFEVRCCQSFKTVRSTQFVICSIANCYTNGVSRQPSKRIVLEPLKTPLPSPPFHPSSLNLVYFLLELQESLPTAKFLFLLLLRMLLNL